MKKSGLGGLIFYLSMVVAGIVIMAIFWGDFWCMMDEPVDMNTIEISELEKNMHVSLDVQFVAGAYANESKETTRYGVAEDVSVDTAKYYLIVLPHYSEASEESLDYYITVKSDAKNYNEYNKLTEDTLAIWDSTYVYTAEENNLIHLEGRLKKLDKRLQTSMKDYFTSDTMKGFVEQGKVVPENCLLFKIEPVKPGVATFMETIGLLMIIVGSVFIVISTKRNRMGMTYGGVAAGDAPLYGASPLRKANMEKDTRTREETAAAYGVGQTIFINGLSYKRTQLEPINRYIAANNITAARQELSKLEGMEEYAIDQVIKNWDVIYK